jgi:hypothetical protein
LIFFTRSSILSDIAQPLLLSFLTFINPPAWANQASIHPMAIAIGTFLGLPLTFLLWMGLLYALARAVRGQGSFFTQVSTTVLFQVPLGLLSSLLILVPFGAGLSITVLGYALLLHVFMLMAVHELSGPKAVMIVFVPVLLLVVLLVTFTLTFVGGMLLFALLGAYLLLLWEFS